MKINDNCSIDHGVTLTSHDEGDVAVAVGVHGHVAALEGGPAIRGKSLTFSS